MLTKEELANIKRIDTSLNVFRKKAEKIAAEVAKLTEELNRKLEPLSKELTDARAEIDFWQKPVIERYGKTTEELLRESGEETATDISSEEESEKVSEPDELEVALAKGKPSSEEPSQIDSETAPVFVPEPSYDEESDSSLENSEEESDGLGLNDLPEEWKD